MEREITPTNIAWVAGVYEGEGCLNFSGGKWHITIQMTDFDVLERIQDILGMGNIYKRPLIQGRKQAWILKTGRREYVQAWLVMMWPYLGFRRKQKAKEFFEWNSFANKIRKANKEAGREKYYYHKDSDTVISDTGTGALRTHFN